MARLKAFDPDEALERAMALFWRDGYDATSLSALLEAMGISRQSLYDTFGDKRSLYLAALDLYAGGFAELVQRHLGSADAGVAALLAFGQSYLATFLHGEGRGTCMMAAAALSIANRDDAVAARVKAHHSALEAALLTTIVNAKRAGEVDPAVDPTAAARLLVAVFSGLSVAHRSGASRTALRRTIEAALGALTRIPRADA
ncbi:MAG: TetR/AcrR family transcriptional regulator [Nannocystaceae bacterium]